MSSSEQPVTACLIIIGNEILSGRTVDANLPYIAQKLDAVQEAVQVWLALRRYQGQFELVQHLQELGHQRLCRQLHRPGLLAQDPLAVVLELGLEPLQVIEVLGRLLLGTVQVRTGPVGGGFTLRPTAAHGVLRGSGRFRLLIGPDPPLVRHLDAAVPIRASFGHPLALISI